MAKKSPKEYGEKYLQKLLSKLPDDVRSSVLPHFAKDEIYHEVGNEVLMLEDYSRAIQEASKMRAENETWHQQLTNWKVEQEQKYAGYTEAINEVEILKAQLAALGSDKGTSVDPTQYYTKAQLEQRLAEAQAQTANSISSQALPLIAYLNTLSVSHFKEFGEVLDANKLIEHSRKLGVPLDRGGYEDFVKEARQSRDAKELEKKLEAARAEGAAKEREKLQGMPYPLVGSDDDPTGNIGALNVLTSRKSNPDAQYGVNAAVKFFNEQSAARRAK